VSKILELHYLQVTTIMAKR